MDYRECDSQPYCDEARDEVVRLRKALLSIADAWTLVTLGKQEQAEEIVPMSVADNWAASFAAFAQDEASQPTSGSSQTRATLSVEWRQSGVRHIWVSSLQR